MAVLVEQVSQLLPENGVIVHDEEAHGRARPVGHERSFAWPRWDSVRRRIGVFLLVVILIAAAQSVLNSTTFDLQPQARYLLVAAAAAAPIAAWTLAGRRAAPAWAARGMAIAALVGVALLLDASGLITAAHTSA